MTKEQMLAHLAAKAYDNKTRDFFSDLLETFNLSEEDPRVPRMYSLAWENGHAFGYLEVFNHFEDLVEVFKQ